MPRSRSSGSTRGFTSTGGPFSRNRRGPGRLHGEASRRSELGRPVEELGRPPPPERRSTTSQSADLDSGDVNDGPLEDAHRALRQAIFAATLGALRRSALGGPHDGRRRQPGRSTTSFIGGHGNGTSTVTSCSSVTTATSLCPRSGAAPDRKRITSGRPRSRIRPAWLYLMGARIAVYGSGNAGRGRVRTGAAPEERHGRRPSSVSPNGGWRPIRSDPVHGRRSRRRRGARASGGAGVAVRVWCRGRWRRRSRR